MTYLNHVTLTTGHIAYQQRDMVSDLAVNTVADLIDFILQGGHPDIPGCPGYLVSGENIGRSLTATIWAGPWDTRTPILTTAVALRSRSGPGLWRQMHVRPSVPLKTDPAKPPSAPWIADRIDAGAVSHPDAMRWTGDFCRTLAWAWMEYNR